MIEMAENKGYPPSLFKTRISWRSELGPCFEFSAINISYEKFFIGYTPFF
jgi:hypothetical protein